MVFLGEKKSVLFALMNLFQGAYGKKPPEDVRMSEIDGLQIDKG